MTVVQQAILLRCRHCCKFLCNVVCPTDVFLFTLLVGLLDLCISKSRKTCRLAEEGVPTQSLNVIYEVKP